MTDKVSQNAVITVDVGDVTLVRGFHACSWIKSSLLPSSISHHLSLFSGRHYALFSRKDHEPYIRNGWEQWDMP